MRRIIILLITAFLLLPMAYPRRTAKDIRRERQATESKIKNTKRQISTNTDETRRELNRLTSLQGDIRANDVRIATLSKRNDSLRHRISALTDSVETTSAKVDRLRRSRAASLRAVRRQRQTAGSFS